VGALLGAATGVTGEVLTVTVCPTSPDTSSSELCDLTRVTSRDGPVSPGLTSWDDTVSPGLTSWVETVSPGLTASMG